MAPDWKEIFRNEDCSKCEFLLLVASDILLCFFFPFEEESTFQQLNEK